MSPEKTKYLKSNFSFYKDLIYGFECDDGWFEIIKELSEEINEILKNFPMCNIEVMQIKEKFGGLRFYYFKKFTQNQENDFSNQITNLVNKAEQKCLKTCESCGKLGNIIQTGYWRVRCKDHQ